MLKKVTFGKPKFNNLNRDYTYVDMHHHSQYSDTYTRVRNIIKCAKKHNIGVSITDHNEIRGSMIADNDKDLFSIPGIEVSSKEGPHVLVYFYDAKELEEYFHKHILNFRGPNPYMRTKVGVADIVDSANLYSTVTTIAHPFSASHLNITRLDDHKEGLTYLSKHADAFEVICGQNIRRWNKMAMNFVHKSGKCYTAGSDGHILNALGTVLTYSKADTREEFLDNIKKRKNYIMGKEMMILQRLYPYVRMAARHTKYFKASVKTQIDYLIEQHKIKQERRKR